MGLSSEGAVRKYIIFKQAWLKDFVQANEISDLIIDFSSAFFPILTRFASRYIRDLRLNSESALEKLSQNISIAVIAELRCYRREFEGPITLVFDGTPPKAKSLVCQARKAKREKALKRLLNTENLKKKEYNRLCRSALHYSPELTSLIFRVLERCFRQDRSVILCKAVSEADTYISTISGRYSLIISTDGDMLFLPAINFVLRYPHRSLKSHDFATSGKFITRKDFKRNLLGDEDVDDIILAVIFTALRNDYNPHRPRSLTYFKLREECMQLHRKLCGQPVNKAFHEYDAYLGSIVIQSGPRLFGSLVKHFLQMINIKFLTLGSKDNFANVEWENFCSGCWNTFFALTGQDKFFEIKPVGSCQERGNPVSSRRENPISTAKLECINLLENYPCIRILPYQSNFSALNPQLSPHSSAADEQIDLYLKLEILIAQVLKCGDFKLVYHQPKRTLKQIFTLANSKYTANLPDLVREKVLSAGKNVSWKKKHEYLPLMVTLGDLLEIDANQCLSEIQNETLKVRILEIEAMLVQERHADTLMKEKISMESCIRTHFFLAKSSSIGDDILENSSVSDLARHLGWRKDQALSRYKSQLYRDYLCNNLQDIDDSQISSMTDAYFIHLVHVNSISMPPNIPISPYLKVVYLAEAKDFDFDQSSRIFKERKKQASYKAIMSYKNMERADNGPVISGEKKINHPIFEVNSSVSIHTVGSFLAGPVVWDAEKGRRKVSVEFARSLSATFGFLMDAVNWDFTIRIQQCVENIKIIIETYDNCRDFIINLFNDNCMRQLLNMVAGNPITGKFKSSKYLLHFATLCTKMPHIHCVSEITHAMRHRLITSLKMTTCYSLAERQRKHMKTLLLSASVECQPIVSAKAKCEISIKMLAGVCCEIVNALRPDEVDIVRISRFLFGKSHHSIDVLKSEGSLERFLILLKQECAIRYAIFADLNPFDQLADQLDRSVFESRAEFYADIIRYNYNMHMRSGVPYLFTPAWRPPGIYLSQREIWTLILNMEKCVAEAALFNEVIKFRPRLNLSEGQLNQCAWYIKESLVNLVNPDKHLKANKINNGTPNIWTSILSFERYGVISDKDIEIIERPAIRRLLKRSEFAGSIQISSVKMTLSLSKHRNTVALSKSKAFDVQFDLHNLDYVAPNPNINVIIAHDLGRTFTTAAAAIRVNEYDSRDATSRGLQFLLKNSKIQTVKKPDSVKFLEFELAQAKSASQRSKRLFEDDGASQMVQYYGRRSFERSQFRDRVVKKARYSSGIADMEKLAIRFFEPASLRAKLIQRKYETHILHVIGPSASYGSSQLFVNLLVEHKNNTGLKRGNAHVHIAVQCEDVTSCISSCCGASVIYPNRTIRLVECTRCRKIFHRDGNAAQVAAGNAICAIKGMEERSYRRKLH